MKRTKRGMTDLMLTAESKDNRRQAPRVDSQYNLTFSGMDAGHMIMGEGVAIDLSREGVGVRGNRFVKPGMHLALFIEIPDSGEHFCIPEARVSWMMGGRFGLEIKSLTLEDQSRLSDLMWTQGQMKDA